MSEAKHTPTPWYADLFGNITTHPPRTGLRQLLPSTGNIGICFDTILKPKHNAAKNAKFIVRACNSHDKLVKACRRLDDYIRLSEARRIGPDVSHDYWESIIADIRTALAEAEK